MKENGTIVDGTYWLKHYFYLKSRQVKWRGYLFIGLLAMREIYTHVKAAKGCKLQHLPLKLE
jgi:hypothetical protein